MELCNSISDCAAGTLHWACHVQDCLSDRALQDRSWQNVAPAAMRTGVWTGGLTATVPSGINAE